METTSSEEIGLRKDQSMQSNLQYGIVSEGFMAKFGFCLRLIKQIGIAIPEKTAYFLPSPKYFNGHKLQTTACVIRMAPLSGAVD